MTAVSFSGKQAGQGCPLYCRRSWEVEPHAMTIIVAYKDLGEGMAQTVVNGTPRPLTSLLRETDYASLTTKCFTVPPSVHDTDHEPTTK